MIKRRASFAVFALTVGSLIVVGALLYFLHGRQVFATVRSLSEAGAASEATGDYQEAFEKYQLALGLKKDDPTLLVDRARCYAKVAESPDMRARAIGFLTKAMGVAPQERRSMLTAQLGEQHLQLGEFRYAENQAHILLGPEPKDSTSPEGHRLLALALVGRAQQGATTDDDLPQGEILPELKLAISLNPEDDQLTAALATVYRSFPAVVEADPESAGTSEEQRIDLANKAVDSFVENYPKNPKAFLIRAAYRKQYGIEGAEEDARKAVDLAGDNRSISRTAFFVFLPTDGSKAEPKDYAEAISLGERLLQDGSPGDPDFYLSLGRAYYLAGSRDKAISIWQKAKDGLSYAPLKFTFLSHIADAQIETEAIADLKATLTEADKVLEQVRTAKSVTGEQYRYHEGNHKLRWSVVRMLDGTSEVAIRDLQKLASQGESGDTSTALKAVYLLAESYARSGAYVEAAKVFDEALKQHLQTADLYGSAGRAWLRAGQHSEARARFKEALDRVETPEATMQFVSLMLDSMNGGGPTSKKQLADEMRLLNQSLLRLENQEIADKSQIHWRTPAMRSEWKRIQLAIDTANGNKDNKDDGAAELQEVEKRGENLPEALGYLTINYELRGQPKEADRILAKLADIGSNAATRYTTELRLAALRKDAPRILDVFRKMTNVVGPAERLPWVVDISSRLRPEQQLPGGKKGADVARELVAMEVDRTPENVGLWKLLVEIDVERRDAAGLAKTIDQLTSAPVKDKTALLYARIFQTLINPKASRKDLQSALATQQEFAALKPKDFFESETLLGLIEHQLGNNVQQLGRSAEQLEHFETAVQAYKRSLDQGERRLFVVDKLIELLPKVGLASEVDTYLQRISADVSASSTLTDAFVWRDYQNGNLDRALARANRAINLRPNDPTARLLLARLLDREKRFDEADAEFAAALKLAEAAPGIWMEYFEFRSEKRGRAVAQELLDRLHANAALAAPQKLATLARCYELLGDQEKAKDFYTEAMKLAPDSIDISLRYCSFQSKLDPKAATVRLRELYALSPSNLGIKRFLATVLASQGDNDLAEAEELLLAGDPNIPDVADDRRTMARLWTQRGGRTNIEKAIKVANEISRAYPNREDDRLYLADLKHRLAKYATDSGTREKLFAEADETLRTTPQGQDDAASPQAKIMRTLNIARFAVRRGDAGAVAVLDELDTKLKEDRPDKVEVITEFLTLCASTRRLNNWEDWVSYLDQIDGNPIRPVAMRAKFLVLEGKQAQAKEILKPALDKEFDAVKTETQRIAKSEVAGRIYSDLELHKEAAEWFRKLVKLEPNRYELLATSLAKAGQLKEAIEFCTARYRDTKDVAVLYVMTDLISSHGKSEGAVKLLLALVREAMKSEKRNPKLLESAGVLEFLLSNHEESERLLREALAMAPRDVSILNNLACVLADKGIKLDEAVTLVDKAIEIQSAEAPLLDTKGIVLLAKEDVTKALPLLELSTSPPNKDPRHHLHLAVAYQMVGKNDDAKKQAAKAKELGIDGLTLTPLDTRFLKKVASVDTTGSR